jgi:DNA-binding GntR family transcriptional regulator
MRDGPYNVFTDAQGSTTYATDDEAGRSVVTDSAPAPRDLLRRQSSGQQAALYIRRLIFDGELGPGMRVPQDQVAEQLGISRIPIREALIILQSEGWVTIELHRGAFINALDQHAVQDHYELYGLTYGLAARRATERNGASLVGDLRPLLKAINETEDPHRITQLTIDFHWQVVDAAASPRIKVVLRGMSGMIPGDFFELVPGAIEGERKGLATITRSIAKGDWNKAADDYLRLMRRQGDLVVKVMKKRGLFDTPT